MNIHELNNFTGTLGSGAYLAIDDGTDTGKISSQGLLAATEARIDNIIAGPAPSAEEIVDARLGADGVPYPSLGDAIRDQFTDVKSALNGVNNALEMYSSANRFNPENATENSSISQSGDLASSQTYFTSDYIECSGKSTFYFTRAIKNTQTFYGINGANVAYFAQYDADKTYISDTRQQWVNSVSLANNCAYVRFSNPMTQLEDAQQILSVTFDSYPTSFEEVEEFFERAYYVNAGRLKADENKINTLESQVDGLLNYPEFVSAFIRYPVMSGVRTDFYYQGITFGNSKLYTGFSSGNGNVHKDSVSYMVSDDTSMASAYITKSSDCTNPSKSITTTILTEVITSTQGSGATPKIMLIGDSHTAIGKYQYYADQYLKARGITPSWLGSLVSSFGLNHEGRSGWRAYTYTNCANGSDDISSLSGINAFYINNAFDFSAYMSNQGYESVDIVVIALGTNDFARSNHKDVLEVIGYWQTIINSIHAYNSNIKIVLWLGTPPCDRNGVDSKAWNEKYQSYNVFDSFRGGAWGHNNIYLLPTLLSVDPIYDFPYAEVAPNPTSSETIIEATDVVHLSDAGYAHLAYPICGMIQYLCSV